ncbi:MAG: hydrogen gas-evolving membrane-bound hydrogenase subunit E [Spirochaetia bacterium]
MTDVYINILLFVVVTTGLLSLLYNDLFVSVILLSIFSFLSALLFYVAHAPDVAITEAAVGAGMTTFIFVWAVRSSSGRPSLDVSAEARASRMESEHTVRRDAFSTPQAVLDLVLVVAMGIVLYLFLPPLSGGAELMRDYLFAHGHEETGALNLVSAVYLGYRAFDTFGETIVLLCAVSGSIYFLSKKH